MSQLECVIAVYEDHAIIRKWNLNTEKFNSGENLTVKTAREIFDFLSKEEHINFSFRGIIPDNVLNFNQDKIIWYTKPSKENYFFFSKGISIEEGYYTTPYLLWKYQNNNLKIFALKTKPKENTPLYYAPFLNTMVDGVCMGNVHFNKELIFYEDIIKDIETKYFNSYFSHVGKTVTKTNIISFYQKIRNIDFKDYPFEDLIKTEYTVKDVI